MSRTLAILSLLVLMATPILADDLATLSLDDASTIGTTIQTDTKIKVEGAGSIKISTLHPTTICLGEVDGLDIGLAKLLYSARVKSDLDGSAYLEMWAHVGGGQYFSRGLDNQVKGKADWTLLQTPFVFQKGQKPDKVVLNLVVNGTGTVWVDDVVLSQQPLR